MHQAMRFIEALLGRFERALDSIRRSNQFKAGSIRSFLTQKPHFTLTRPRGTQHYFCLRRHAFCRYLRCRRSEPSLPLLSTNEFDGSHRFLPLSRERTVGSSATNGHPLELLLLSLLLSTTFVVVATTICSFHHCRCCCHHRCS